jgi:erythronate-4-phosphate dehydrogenase
MIYEATCRFLGKRPEWDPTPLLPAPDRPKVRVRGDAQLPQEVIGAAVRSVYDIWRDDAAMRQLLTVPEEKKGPLFDRMRRKYPYRREFHNTRVKVSPPNRALAAQLRDMGFNCRTE